MLRNLKGTEALHENTEFKCILYRSRLTPMNSLSSLKILQMNYKSAWEMLTGDPFPPHILCMQFSLYSLLYKLYASSLFVLRPL